MVFLRKTIKREALDHGKEKKRMHACAKRMIVTLRVTMVSLRETIKREALDLVLCFYEVKTTTSMVSLRETIKREALDCHPSGDHGFPSGNNQVDLVLCFYEVKTTTSMVSRRETIKGFALDQGVRPCMVFLRKTIKRF